MFGKAKADVHAVTDLSLDAHRGQILTLLGPNGSGKSTTLNSIAGLSTVTDGSIELRSDEGLGIAPQANVMWKELTVEEHVRVFVTLKATSSMSRAEVTAETDRLVAACDLEKKRHAKTSTLSGGQKRKLQLAMMFAGGSGICCVDEVSSGLDPLSRRKVWDILLAERSRRTIIMTTHFLDEADSLADYIVIMSKGRLAAQGSASDLKEKLGNGYTAIVSNTTGVKLPPGSEYVQKEEFQGTTTYRIANSAHVAGFVETLEAAGITDFTLSGPKIEELFLKIAGESNDESTENQELETGETTHEHTHQPALDLQKGRQVSAVRQIWVLYRKRLTVFRHSFMPYLVAVAIMLVGAGVAPSLLKTLHQRPGCLDVSSGEQFDTYSFRNNLATNIASGGASIVLGPTSKIPDDAYASIASLYNANTTSAPEYFGFHNESDVKGLFAFVETIDEFHKYIQDNRVQLQLGGIFLSDPPVMAINHPTFYSSMLQAPLLIQNIYTILTGTNVSTSVSIFGTVAAPQSFDFASLVFMFYFGLISVVYTAFFTIYPTSERINGVRAMQYSNGVRPLPLWAAHLLFDMTCILIVSVVSVILLSVATSIWLSLTFFWVVLFFYSITSALLGYTISQFAPSPIAAWAFSAFGQLVMYMAIYGGTIGIVATVEYRSMTHLSDTIYYVLAIISPAVNLFRGVETALGQFNQNCRGDISNGSISLYGAPILYLVIQAVLLMAILVWMDSGNTASALSRLTTRKAKTGSDDTEALNANPNGLEVMSLTKKYGSNTVVDDVSFSVPPSTTFALLGPNGAGKSTTISLIRGDIAPSTSNSRISVASISPLTHRAQARANLGVCPQFDATDILTVKEMLSFYAQIRGVPDVARDVATVMAACGITSYADRLSTALSGGTKRKLSLAIALLGNPSVLLLDEPSSGLDAAAKRTLWRTLQAVSKGRAVVLTTHSMEEAEAVCSVVGILSSRMLALGPREVIKRQGGGEAFYVHLEAGSGLATGAQEANNIREFVFTKFPDAVLERDMVAGQIRFQVPSSGGLSMSGLFRTLEEGKARLGLSSYSVGRPTLDQVFVNVVEKHGGQEENHGLVERKGWLDILRRK